MQNANGKCQKEDTYCWPRLIEQLKMQNANGKCQMGILTVDFLVIKVVKKCKVRMFSSPFDFTQGDSIAPSLHQSVSRSLFT